MKKTKYLVLFMIAVRACAGLQAQDLKQDIKEARAAYSNLDRLHVSILIQAFEDEVTTRPYYSITADIKRDGDNYLYHFGDTEMLLNTKYLVLVDKDVKEISCSKRDPKKIPAVFNDPMQVNFDSVIHHYGAHQFLGQKDAMKKYRLSPKSGEVKYIDLYLHQGSKLIRKIEYHYREGQVVNVDFKTFDQHPEFKPDTFTETQYVSVTKNKIVTAAQFKGYRISNDEDR